jgi:hypothetical protein
MSLEGARRELEQEKAPAIARATALLESEGYLVIQPEVVSIVRTEEYRKRLEEATERYNSWPKWMQ